MLGRLRSIKFGPISSGKENIVPASLAAELKLPEGEMRGAMSALATRGLLGYDVSQQSWFHRELPFQSDLVESLHPRLVAARKLIAQAGVRLHQQIGDHDVELLVRGSDVEHLVRLSEDAGSLHLHLVQQVSEHAWSL